MSMDSNDEDTEFSYNFKDMCVSVKGPNLSTYRNNNMMRTMQMTRGFGQPDDTRSVYDQRSINSRRGMSPRSIRSVCDYQPRNFMFSHYPNGIRSESVYNSQDTRSYAIATEIALSLRKNNQFNELDVAIIKSAYKVFIKRYKQLDFGDQGTDTSLSNDDNDSIRSTRNSIFKENISSVCKSTKAYSTTSQKSRPKSIYSGRSAHFRQNTKLNIHSLNISSNLPNNSQMEKFSNQTLQKDRFQNGHLYPSQRFNRWIAATAITENMSKAQPTITCGVNMGQKFNENLTVDNLTSKTNHEELFSEIPVEKNSNRKESCKRKLEEDSSTAMTSKKRPKLSPIKKITNTKVTQNTKVTGKDKTSGFCFVKPSLPVTKTSKTKTVEKLVSKSADTFVDIAPTPEVNIAQDVDEPVNKSFSEPTENSTNNVSTRPSFIKRKLFTQNLDVAENKNISFDNVNSPVNSSSQLQKQKNKIRKFVSNQSCLDRDVSQETNVIDLIHKIVTPSQMNSTNQNNVAIHGNKEEKRNEWDVDLIMSGCQDTQGSDTYTDEDIFEQNAAGCTKENNVESNDKNKKIMKNCQVLIENNTLINSNSKSTLATNNDTEKLQSSDKQQNHEVKDKETNSNIIRKSFWTTDLESDTEYQNTEKRCPVSLQKDKKKGNNKSKTKIRLNQFWDTDLESDIELQEVPKELPISLNKDKEQFEKKDETVANQLTKTVNDNNQISNNTEHNFDNKSTYSSTSYIDKLNNTKFRIRSHRAPKKIKCCAEPDLSVNKTVAVNVQCNSRYVDNSVAKNIANSKPMKNIKLVNNKRSCHTRKEVQIDKPKQTDVAQDECIQKATVAKTKSKKNIKSNKTETLQSNRNTETIKGQAKQRKISRKHIDLTQSVSDISFSLLETSVMTRSRTRSVSKPTNNYSHK